MRIRVYQLEPEAKAVGYDSWGIFGLEIDETKLTPARMKALVGDGGVLSLGQHTRDEAGVLARLDELCRGNAKGGDKMSEVQKSMRYRINIARGMKGAVSFEATVDGENYEMAEVLEKSDALVAQLERRYPAPLEGK